MFMYLYIYTYIHNLIIPNIQYSENTHISIYYVYIYIYICFLQWVFQGFVLHPGVADPPTLFFYVKTPLLRDVTGMVGIGL